MREVCCASPGRADANFEDFLVEQRLIVEEVGDPERDEVAVNPPLVGEHRAQANVLGSWMLAAPRANVVGRRYFGFIKANARTVVPSVVS